MQRYLYRVAYTHADGSVAYEPVCVQAVDETAAQTEVEAVTTRYPTAVGATRTVTLVTVTADA